MKSEQLGINRSRLPNFKQQKSRPHLFYHSTPCLQFRNMWDVFNAHWDRQVLLPLLQIFVQLPKILYRTTRPWQWEIWDQHYSLLTSSLFLSDLLCCLPPPSCAHNIHQTHQGSCIYFPSFLTAPCSSFPFFSQGFNHTSADIQQVSAAVLQVKDIL